MPLNTNVDLSESGDEFHEEAQGSSSLTVSRKRTVDLSDDEIEKPSRKMRRLQSSVSPKEKLSSEMTLRVLIGSKCKSCKSRCMTQFQAPFLFHQLMQFRVDWSKTGKLDQDIIVSLLNELYMYYVTSW